MTQTKQFLSMIQQKGDKKNQYIFDKEQEEKVKTLIKDLKSHLQILAEGSIMSSDDI